MGGPAPADLVARVTRLHAARPQGSVSVRPVAYGPDPGSKAFHDLVSCARLRTDA